jgi:ATP-dependent Clp protease adaptor protein ClpS
MNYLFHTFETNILEMTPTCHTSVLTKAKTEVKRPSLYHVILLNDDYTPMDFVVYVLQRFFNKSTDESVALMLQVHEQGSAVCGVFTYEIAEAKMNAVIECAVENGHPLECIIEKE